MGERWRAVVSFGGVYADAYQVSDQGNARSIRRQVAGRTGRSGLGSTRTVQGKELSPRIRPDGTRAVNLWLGNNYRQVPIARLVLEAFDRPQPPGHDADNKDGDKANCRLSNLRWKPVGGLALLHQIVNR